MFRARGRSNSPAATGLTAFRSQPAEDDEVPAQVHEVAFDSDGQDAAVSLVSVPYELTLQARQALVLSALKRVCAAGADGANAALWAPLLSRLISRGLEDPDAPAENRDETSEDLRRHLFSFITANLQTRCARVIMLPGEPQAHLFAPVQDGAGPTVAERGVVRFTLCRRRDCESVPYYSRDMSSP